MPAARQSADERRRGLEKPDEVDDDGCEKVEAPGGKGEEGALRLNLARLRGRRARARTRGAYCGEPEPCPRRDRRDCDDPRREASAGRARRGARAGHAEHRAEE